MSTVLELQLEALGRLRPQLGQLGGSLRASAQSPHAGATPDAGADSPLLAAARAVSAETIPGLENTIADRFIEVGNLIEVARTQFARAENDLTSVITSAGTLLPTSG